MTDLLTRIIARAERRALYDIHPELTERIPILRVYSDQVAGESGATFASSATDYARHAWVHKAVKVLADNICPLPVRIVEGEGEEQKPLPKHPISVLLANPNKAMSAADLWRAWSTDLMLGGEEGMEVVRSQSGARVLELWPRQPHAFSVKPLDSRYMEVDSYKIDDGHGQPYMLTPDQFIHFRFYNPMNPWRGLSPIGAIRMSIQIDQFSQAWSRMFFKNSARPDFAIIAPEGVTKSEKDDIKTQLKEQHSGEHAHEALILEKGVADIKPLNFPPKDMEWVEQRKLSREEIGAIFGVPDEVMGWGRDTYENFDTAARVLWTITIIPILGMRDSALTAWLRRYKLIEPGQSAMTDLSGVRELRQDTGQKIDQAGKLFTMGRPFNQINELLGLGMPKTPDGEIGYLPLSLVPVSEAGRTPSVVQEAAKPQDKSLKPEYGSARHEATWKGHQARIGTAVGVMRRMLRKSFQEQQIEVGKKLRNSREFGRGRFKDNVPPVQQLFDPDAEAKEWEEWYADLIAKVYGEVAQSELDGLGIGIDFDMTRPDTRANVRQILHAFALKTNQTTYDELVDLFADAEEAGEGIPAIMERLSAYFEGRKSEYQTERIARTTMTGVSNSGSIDAWKQSGVVGGQTWISALQPDRTRDAHAEAHGQTVGLGEQFEVGGEYLAYPGDPNGSPGNIINCLCTTIADVTEELAAGLLAGGGHRPRAGRRAVLGARARPANGVGRAPSLAVPGG